MNKIHKFRPNKWAFTALLLPLIGAAEATLVQSLESKLEFPGYSTASAVDLVNSGQPSFLSMEVSVAPHAAFPATSLNDGISYSVSNGENVYFTTLPSTVTFTLDTSVNTLGYDITGVTTFAGWNDGKGQFANQKYDLLVSVVGSLDFTLLTNVLYTPITNGTTAASSSAGLSDSSGVMATGGRRRSLCFSKFWKRYRLPRDRCGGISGRGGLGSGNSSHRISFGVGICCGYV